MKIISVFLYLQKGEIMLVKYKYPEIVSELRKNAESQQHLADFLEVDVTTLRAKLSGTKDVPRLAVFRSNKNISCQVIDDEAGTTLASASSLSCTAA